MPKSKKASKHATPMALKTADYLISPRTFATGGAERAGRAKPKTRTTTPSRR
jgi:hypothetical protein